MKSKHLSPIVFAAFIIILTIVSCKEKRKPIGQKEVVTKTEELKLTVAEVIESSLEEAEDNGGRVGGIDLHEFEKVKGLYEDQSYAPLWTNNGAWLPAGDSLYAFVRHAAEYGLYPQDYHADRIDTLHWKTVRDTSRTNRLDASLWAESELLLTSALIKVVNDLKVGRLVADSILHRDTSLSKMFYRKALDSFRVMSTASFAATLEPRHKGYQDLKAALQSFLPGADLTRRTHINTKDTLHYAAQVSRRLVEDSIAVADPRDSVLLAAGIRSWQKAHGMKVDGRMSAALFARMNRTAADTFLQVALTLDRYKSLPTMPATYVWVNIPSYRLDVVDADTVVLTSRVVVGKPETRTPVLTSVISDMITYPLWHIPNSIIVKDILPALKKDPGYLARKGFSLVDDKHNEIDPYTVDWSKYNKGIPYTVVQGSGDANALGVIKFNFPNNYSVYLHDTNQREFFSRAKRALSHGCVRVASWEDLSTYLLSRDSTAANAVPLDSMQTWLLRKEKHVIPLHNRVPLYIRYFSAEGKDGELALHEDIYGEDRRLRQTYFATK
ncbi:MAG: L,D-transpeptidase family protein [Flaviaesturariibacter sp.]|nr:L,D-transpeptidase family protein [Flaviaesturariibacter sp.]